MLRQILFNNLAWPSMARRAEADGITPNNSSPDELSGRMPTFARRKLEIDPEKVEIQFSRSAIECFGRLEAALPEPDGKSPSGSRYIYFDSTIRKRLQELAAGKPTGIGNALWAISRITEE